MNNELIQQMIYELLGEFGEDLANEHTEVCETIAHIINGSPMDMPVNKMVSIILQEVDIKYMSLIATMVQYSIPDSASHLVDANPDLVIFNHLSHYLILKDDQEETVSIPSPSNLH